MSKSSNYCLLIEIMRVYILPELIAFRVFYSINTAADELMFSSSLRGLDLYHHEIVKPLVSVFLVDSSKGLACHLVVILGYDNIFNSPPPGS